MCFKPTKKLNFAGVCTMYLKKAARDRMLLFCEKCAGEFKELEPKNITNKQLQLF